VLLDFTVIEQGAWLNEKKPYSPPPFMNKITIPQKLQLLVEAFRARTPEAAKDLIMGAAKVICGERNAISKAEIKTIYTLMNTLNPQDALEAIYVAQIIASNLLGMQKLTAQYEEDRRMGLKILKFCNTAMLDLDKKRDGRMQDRSNLGGHKWAMTLKE